MSQKDLSHQTWTNLSQSPKNLKSFSFWLKTWSSLQEAWIRPKKFKKMYKLG